MTNSGFVRADGDQLVDDSGPLLLRGVGLGNWLLPEGYMWRFGDDLASPRQIERRIDQLIGDVDATKFWQRFRDAFITESDFALISRLGFDHVRLPLNSRLLQDDSGSMRPGWFIYIDRAVSWAEATGLRVLIDLHGAPGGQTGTNIDDSPRGLPELFLERSYRDQTIALWTQIAARYRGRTAVLGYDLLNEPLPNEWQYQFGAQLTELYHELTAAIRAVDPDHVLMYEGSHWATNPEPVLRRFDPNQAVQFHRYWCPPDVSSIDDFLSLRRELGTPIYMGEGGENTPAWLYAATRLFERHRIGWNLWPWKKADTTTSPLSVPLPADWELIADLSRTPAPSRAAAILDDFLGAVGVEACDVRTEVLAAVHARPPLVLPAWAGVVSSRQSDAAEELIVDFVDQPLPEMLWHHTSGLPYTAEEEQVTVTLTSDRSLAFVLNQAPTTWSIDASPPGRVRGEWDGTVLRLTAPSPVAVRSVKVTA